MKKTMIFVLLGFGFLLSGNAVAQSGARQVVLTYDLKRIPGPGSNQLAVWVEDMSGKYVCTIFATRFTASGGYTKRPASLSEWVGKSGWAEASAAEVDAVSGSTQAAGANTLVWDCRDRSGKPVPDGKYVIRMEANIKNERRMFYRAEVNVGGPAARSEGTITFSPEEAASGDRIFQHVVTAYR